MMGYNYSDWTHGWMSAFDGFTVFYRSFLEISDNLKKHFSEPEEKTLDPVYSIALSSDSVPIVSVKQTKEGSYGRRTVEKTGHDPLVIDYWSMNS